MALAGSLMGCSFSLNKDADGSSKKTGTTVTKETGKTDESTDATKEVSEEQTNAGTTEETPSTAEADGEASALPEEKKVGFGTNEMPEEYSDDMVVDSKLSCEVQTYDGVAV